MILFAGFFGAAVAYRNKPEIHKRLIIAATVALAFAAVGRMNFGLAVSPFFIMGASILCALSSFPAGFVLLAMLLPFASADEADRFARSQEHVDPVQPRIVRRNGKIDIEIP